MALIEVSENRNTFGYGRFTPRADQSKHGVIWAAVEGPNDGRWPSVREAQEGLLVGDGKRKIGYTEFTDDLTGTHDITVGTTKLREMICPLEDIKEKDKYEGKLSTDSLNNFKSEEQRKAQQRGFNAEFASKTEEVTLTPPT